MLLDANGDLSPGRLHFDDAFPNFPGQRSGNLHRLLLGFTNQALKLFEDFFFLDVGCVTTLRRARVPVLHIQGITFVVGCLLSNFVHWCGLRSC